ncbi:hypothetical protein HPB48_018970 [Haemaphysalis longicornis]|uniref:Uncharacterized protein n=1 Tax=Haemaphysalis longicornis TaxID=44386 RepID=A0A9J6GT96_HAELO|nr:hypothetical protein HPB48_018970 [Haemaphysalis longicornis]
MSHFRALVQMKWCPLLKMPIMPGNDHAIHLRWTAHSASLATDIATLLKLTFNLNKIGVGPVTFRYSRGGLAITPKFRDNFDKLEEATAMPFTRAALEVRKQIWQGNRSEQIKMSVLDSAIVPGMLLNQINPQNIGTISANKFRHHTTFTERFQTKTHVISLSPRVFASLAEHGKYMCNECRKMEMTIQPLFLGKHLHLRLVESARTDNGEGLGLAWIRGVPRYKTSKLLLLQHATAQLEPCNRQHHLAWSCTPWLYCLPPFLRPRDSSRLLVDGTDSDEAESESDDELPATEPDSTYHVSFDESFVSDHAAEEATDPHKERNFIMFESKLRQLFASSQHCHEPCQVLFKVEEGSMLQVESRCRVGHTIIWESQPFLNHKPAGNALLAAAIPFAGCSVAPCLRSLQSINFQAISETTYYTYQKRYLVPAVTTEKQDALVQSVVGTAGDLAGDGRCDSRGHSAKYCTYVLYAEQIGRILHCENVTFHQSPAVPNSAAMEKEGLSNSMDAFERQGINIRSLTTDSHPAIRSFFRKERLTIKQYFDTWHISKGIQKKLRAACKSQSCAFIQPWMQCITNHLDFVAAMAEGDAELIISMWRSLLNHICDKHDGHEGPFAECLHEPLR